MLAQNLRKRGRTEGSLFSSKGVRRNVVGGSESCSAFRHVRKNFGK